MLRWVHIMILRNLLKFKTMSNFEHKHSVFEMNHEREKQKKKCWLYDNVQNFIPPRNLAFQEM